MKNKIIVLLSLVTLLLAAGTSLAANDTLAEGSLKGAYSSWGKPSLQGDWKIVTEGEQVFIELADNFLAKKGPDVKIFLSPTESSKITGDNATQGSVFIHQISDFKGKNRIEIPAGIDLSQFSTLVFHCEEYSKLWGVSSLELLNQ